MDAFTLLNFWRNAGANHGDGGCLDAELPISSKETTAAAGNSNPAVEMYDDNEDDDFFDLNFQVPECDGKEKGDAEKNVINRFIDIDENRLSNFEGRISHLEQNSKPQSPISLLRSPPKFRVFMTGFKKSKLETTVTIDASTATNNKHRPQKSPDQRQSKHLTVKCEVEEVQIASLFAGESSLRSKSEEEESSKRFPKIVLQKYLKLIKPLYVRVSKRYVAKIKVPDYSSTTTKTPLASPVTARTFPRRKQVCEKHSSRPAALRVVCKHLGKSRSASSAAVGEVQSGPPSRRDDSLLQQHDGIQSAILHCKRSFNSPTESSILSRSVSAAWHDKSISPGGSFYLEQTRCSI